MQKYENKNLTNRTQFAKKCSNIMLSIGKRHNLGRNTILQNKCQQNHTNRAYSYNSVAKCECDHSEKYDNKHKNMNKN